MIITQNEFLILHTISLDEQKSIWQISRRVRLSYPATHKIVHNLQRRGYLTLHRNKNRSLSCKNSVLGNIVIEHYNKMMSEIKQNERVTKHRK